MERYPVELSDDVACHWSVVFDSRSLPLPLQVCVCVKTFVHLVCLSNNSTDDTDTCFL